jgi:hypothetical protein
VGDTVTEDSPDQIRRRIGRARAVLSKRHAIEPQRVIRFEARMARLADVRRREQPPKRWCILRTSSRTTVALLDDLEKAGFDVWTPTQVIEKRFGRARETVERCTAIMPSFLFASEDDAANLLRLSSDPMKRCVDFSVFHHRDQVPLIADRDLAALRGMEDLATAGRDQAKERRRRHAELSTEKQRLAVLRNGAKPIPAGQSVRMPEGAWGGMLGIAVKSERGVTTVNLGGLMDVKIDTFLLVSDILERKSP